MKKIAIITIVSVVIFLADDAQAKDLFVAPGGSDAVTYAANDISHPWTSILRAMQQVQAGDVVYFRQGTYDIPSGGIVISTGFAAGTTESPIRLTSYPNELATWRSTQTNVTIRVGRDHWHFDNLNFVHEPSGSMSGDRGFFQCGYSTTGADGFWVKESTFSMNSRGDNYGSVHLKMESPCTNVEITHNTIIHSGGSGLTNSSGIIAFGNNTFKINNNTVAGPPMGIYLKHANSSTCGNVSGEVKNNWVRNNERRAFFSNFNCVVIENNIFDSRASGSAEGGNQFNESNGVSGGDNNLINHNTFLGGLWFHDDASGAINNTLTNNIIYAKAWNLHPWSGGTIGTGNVNSNYNLFQAGSVVLMDGTNYTLSSWRTVSGEDVNSLSGTPTFINISLDSIDDYALTSSSLGYRAASDGKDMGADISLVGVNSEGLVSPTETCSDGIQNQDETGVDCGGVCPACETPATTYSLANFLSLLANWLGAGDEDSDVNNDGIVNTRDLGIIMSGWGN
ncbi:MAG: hypothetical protein PHH24_04155 [Candidatus Moranbacteria bacterium]|jgi:hypothetical protein|nr:hypothetical protein [Candidatus Moranbacteria bacterium]MDD5651915.1 hypothetical protein [Candidatus Moranbacteria bacterium]MDX9855202.1 hypothetical protein [Candidatus Moranbacteria bacterium]